MKKISILTAAVLLAVVLAGCGNQSATTNGPKNNISGAGGNKGDVDNNICNFFTADFVYSVLHKPIVKVEPSKLATVFSCDYYTDYQEDFYKDAEHNRISPGGPSILIVLDNLNVERQKEARQYLGLTLDTSAKINMENIISYRADKSIWSVDLIINPNRFVWANYSHQAITDDELITLAAAMADKIQGRLKIKIEKNPIDLAVAAAKALGESQEKTVSQFFDYLSGKKIPEAIALMDASDNTKQGWGVNFNTLEALKVNKIEEAFKEEWTPTRQVFKVELDVKVKPAGEQLGWENGKNFRWVSLQKTGDNWLVHELATNP